MHDISKPLPTWLIMDSQIIRCSHTADGERTAAKAKLTAVGRCLGEVKYKFRHFLKIFTAPLTWCSSFQQTSFYYGIKFSLRIFQQRLIIIHNSKFVFWTKCIPPKSRNKSNDIKQAISRILISRQDRDKVLDWHVKSIRHQSVYLLCISAVRYRLIVIVL